MKIIEKKNLTYAKNMMVANGNYLVRPAKNLKILQAEDRTENKVRELEQRKEILRFVDEMIDFMKDKGKEKGQLTITLIFEK